LLSKAGSAGFWVQAWVRVVRKPPVAGPKPTQAMSTSMDWRSLSRIGETSVVASSLMRDNPGFGDHYLADGVGGAVFGEAAAAEAGRQLALQAKELGGADAAGAGAGFRRVRAVGGETSTAMAVMPGMVSSYASSSLDRKQLLWSSSSQAGWRL